MCLLSQERHSCGSTGRCSLRPVLGSEDALGTPPGQELKDVWGLVHRKTGASLPVGESLIIQVDAQLLP